MAYSEDSWLAPTFDDSSWSKAKSPFGFGPQRYGLQFTTEVPEGSGSVLFRGSVDISAADLRAVQSGAQGSAVLVVKVAADNNATVWLNGYKLVEDDTADDAREWNIDRGGIRLPAAVVGDGSSDRTLTVAVQVDNGRASPDFFFEMILAYSAPDISGVIMSNGIDYTKCFSEFGAPEIAVGTRICGFVE